MRPRRRSTRLVQVARSARIRLRCRHLSKQRSAWGREALVPPQLLPENISSHTTMIVSKSRCHSAATSTTAAGVDYRLEGGNQSRLEVRVSSNGLSHSGYRLLRVIIVCLLQARKVVRQAFLRVGLVEEFMVGGTKVR